MSDRVAVMNRGKVEQIGHPTDVYNRPRTRFVSEFLGAANVFTGTVTASRGDRQWLVGFDLQPPAEGVVESAEPLRPGQRVTVAIRPERMKLVPPTAGTICAQVRDVVFRGTYFAYELTLRGQQQPLFAYSQDRQIIGHDGVGLTWAAENAVVLQDAE